ncbi:class II aldolase/adducin family protein [Pseudorhodoferax sp.]|uniref:class II aldolase/adducin family protein n=1 Tax=Pseudorhodoferax sp. TaxID=1993553 RepID=UPI002DD681B8|nr:class II aldolase/adducin family protein [Pseudorhodoferax sp.]
MDAAALPVCPAGMDPVEWRLRLELAACYRLFDWMGWTTLIYNHISVRVPAPEPQFLINHFGLHYTEVTARNLLKIDVEGRKLDPSPHPVNAAGFVIHSAIHAARDDAHCIAHTHTTAGMAVACKASGLRHDNFNSALLHGQVAYHDFEGVTTDAAEKPRLVASIGAKPILILRNHGLLVAAASVPEAFGLMATLEKACEVQLATDSLAGPTLAIGADVLAAIPAQNAAVAKASSRPGQMVFDACLRRAGIRYADLA